MSFFFFYFFLKIKKILFLIFFFFFFFFFFFKINYILYYNKNIIKIKIIVSIYRYSRDLRFQISLALFKLLSLKILFFNYSKKELY